MSLCGCYPSCSCELNVEPPELLTLTGSGDPSSGGWTLTALETVFSAAAADNAIAITPGGAYGHSPQIGLNIEDTDSVDLNIGAGGLNADVRIDPASPTPITVTAAGLSIPLMPAAGGDVPTGSILDFYGATLPAGGWLLCYGQFVPQATYPTLFAVIGHTANGGTDPGDGTFKIPDFRGRVAAGVDNMGGVAAGEMPGYTSIGDVGGDDTNALTSSNLPAHTHTVNDPSHSHTTSSVSTQADHFHEPGTITRNFVTAENPKQVTVASGASYTIVVTNGGADNNRQLNNAATSNAGSHTHTVALNSAATGITVSGGGNGSSPGNAFSNLQPFHMVHKIIKT